MIAFRAAGDARIVARRALRYADGGDARTGRPAHVRAASGLAWQVMDGRRVLVAPQDDTSFLAVFEPPDGDVAAITVDHAPSGLRVFEERAGTKKLKMDLESIAAIDDTRALLVGSGSQANRRRMVLLEGTATRIVDCAALYDALAARTDFAGSELNIEGAARIGERFFLANRGNGAAQGGLAPVDAIAELSVEALLAYLDAGPVPPIRRVWPADLGTVRGARLTFTDIAPGPDGRAWFLASAELSPNAQDDGEVVGAAIGTLDLDAGTGELAVLQDADGAPARCKPEGLAIVGVRGPNVVAYAVVDADDPDVPSALLTIELPTR